MSERDWKRIEKLNRDRYRWLRKYELDDADQSDAAIDERLLAEKVANELAELEDAIARRDARKARKRSRIVAECFDRLTLMRVGRKV